MNKMKCNCHGGVKFLMALSLLTLFLAVMVSVVGTSFWLAGTQWILISILLAVYANHLQSCHGDSHNCSSEKSENENSDE